MQSGRVSKAFNAFNHAAGRLLAAGAIYGGIAVSPAAAAEPIVNTPPLDMDGFSLSQAPMAEWPTQQRADALRFAMNFMDERAEFAGAIKRCAIDSTSCSSGLGLSMDAVYRISLIGNRRLQLELVNAFVNTLIREDEREAQSPAHTYSALAAVNKRKGACQQKAYLKHFMAEMLGFPDNDIALVFEVAANATTRVPVGHVVVEARLDGKNWILDDQQAPATENAIDRAGFWAIAAANSQLLSDRNQTNLTARNPFIEERFAKLYPWVAVQTQGFGVYADVHLPIPDAVGVRQETRWNATVVSTDVSRDAHYTGDLRRVEAILEPAIAATYRVQTAFAQGQTPQP